MPSLAPCHLTCVTLQDPSRLQSSSEESHIPSHLCGQHHHATLPIKCTQQWHHGREAKYQFPWAMRKCKQKSHISNKSARLSPRKRPTQRKLRNLQSKREKRDNDNAYTHCHNPKPCVYQAHATNKIKYSHHNTRLFINSKLQSTTVHQQKYARHLNTNGTISFNPPPINPQYNQYITTHYSQNPSTTRGRETILRYTIPDPWIQITTKKTQPTIHIA